MIRQTQIQDIPEIIQVLHDGIRSCRLDHEYHEPTIQQWIEDKTHENLLLWIHYNDSWVYTIQGKVVGFIMIDDAGKIIMKYIAPHVQYQGIGKALLSDCIKLMKNRKIKHITVHSTHTAREFFLKQGFEISDQSASGVVMYKAI